MTLEIPQLPEGRYFVYDSAPSLFLGRRGHGPLEVVWDTNILIDYLKYGARIWEGEDFEVSDEDYYAELEGLTQLITCGLGVTSVYTFAGIDHKCQTGAQ